MAIFQRSATPPLRFYQIVMLTFSVIVRPNGNGLVGEITSGLDGELDSNRLFPLIPSSMSFTHPSFFRSGNQSKYFLIAELFFKSESLDFLFFSIICTCVV